MSLEIDWTEMKQFFPFKKKKKKSLRRHLKAKSVRGQDLK